MNIKQKYMYVSIFFMANLLTIFFPFNNFVSFSKLSFSDGILEKLDLIVTYIHNEPHGV